MYTYHLKGSYWCDDSAEKVEGDIDEQMDALTENAAKCLVIQRTEGLYPHLNITITFEEVVLIGVVPQEEDGRIFTADHMHDFAATMVKEAFKRAGIGVTGVDKFIEKHLIDEPGN